MCRRSKTRGRRAAAMLASSLAVIASLPAVAQETLDSAEARQIVERADRANTPPAMVETMKMLLIEKGGKQFERRLRMWTVKAEGGDHWLMRFLSPDEIRGTGLLTIEHRGGLDEQWFYLPATRRIRRIAGVDRRNRFLGTEFLYEDLQGFHPEDYTFHRLREEDVDGEPCDVIEAVPTPEARSRSAYARKVLFIGEKTLVLRRADLYGEDGSKLKVLTETGVKEVLTGIFLPGHLLMKNVTNGRSTSLDIVERKLPGSLPPDTFSQRNLRRRLRPDER
jgi:hypothetical protein